MAHPVNPYVAGTPLRQRQGFFGRQDVIQWVIRELKNPSTSALVLHGQRRIGKTSLLLQLQKYLPEAEFFPVYFDLHDLASAPLGQTLADLADLVLEKLGSDPPESLKFDDQGRVFRQKFLPFWLSQLGETRRPVLMLDEFDVLDTLEEANLKPEASSKALLPFLRKLMAEQPRLAILFVAGRRPQDLSLNFLATFKASLSKEIWVLDEGSARALILQATDNHTLQFEEGALNAILELTNGHPYLAQLLCQRIWERAYTNEPQSAPLVSAAEVWSCVPDVIEAGVQAFQWLWEGLLPPERIYLAALAELVHENQAITENQVIAVLSSEASRLRTREVELAPRDLVQRRIIEPAGEGTYRFSNQLLYYWIRDHYPLQAVKDELDRINPNADMIFRVGEGYFRERRWREAVSFFESTLAENPTHFQAHILLGEAYLALNNTTRALEYLRQAYQLDREDARMPLARGLLAHARYLVAQGDPSGAVAACTEALSISPGERQAQRMIDEVNIHAAEEKIQSETANKNWVAAAGLLSELISRYGADYESKRLSWENQLNDTRLNISLQEYYETGSQALQRGDWVLAEKTFIQAIQLSPSFRDVIGKLAEAHQNKVRDKKIPKIKISLTHSISMTIPKDPLWAFLLTPRLIGIFSFVAVYAAVMIWLYSIIGWWIIAVVFFTLGFLVPVTLLPGPFTQILFAEYRSNHSLLFLGNDGKARLVNLNTHKTVLKKRIYWDPSRVGFALNPGQDMACFSNGKLYEISETFRQKPALFSTSGTTSSTTGESTSSAVYTPIQYAFISKEAMVYSKNNELNLMNVQSGALIKKITAPGQVLCLAANGKYLAAGVLAPPLHSVCAWDFENDDIHYQIEDSNFEATHIVMNRGFYLICASEAGKIQIHHLTQKRMLSEFDAKAEVTAMSLCRNNIYLAIGVAGGIEKENELILLDVYSGAMLERQKVDNKLLTLSFVTENKLYGLLADRRVIAWEITPAAIFPPEHLDEPYLVLLKTRG
jgi:tetratricopeptide (TPR) repeat protein